MSFVLNGLWLIINGLAVENGWSFWAAVYVLGLYALLLWRSYFMLSVHYTGAPLAQRIFVYAPLSLNLAWVTVAAFVNFSNTAMNENLDFTKRENRTAIGGPDWAMGVLVFATSVACYLTVTNCDFVYAFATFWALQGVERQQQNDSGFPHPVSSRVHDMAYVTSGIVAVFGVVAFLRSLFSRRSSFSTSSKTKLESLYHPVLMELRKNYVPLRD